MAILLPLTGPSAAIGAALFNAAQLALFELADGNFTLLPFDTKGTAEGAAAAARQALAQHAGLIIGPLFSAEAKAVAALTKPAGISVVALTADRAAAGPGVYVLGFLPGPQALRVAEFAHAQGRSRLAVLAPSNDYGRTVVEYLSNFGAPMGVTVSVLQYYDADAGDLTVPLKRLMKPNAKQPGDPGFDALLLPDEGPRLRNLAGLLAGQGIDPAQIKLLGTMLWEDSRPNTVAALSGGWYAASAPAAHGDFDQRFAKAFGAKPPRLASLGYDATALAAVLARQGGLGFTPAGLTNPLGFAGVDGLFRLKNDGTTERGYAVMEVVPDGQPHEVSPAPGSFLP